MNTVGDYVNIVNQFVVLVVRLGLCIISDMTEMLLYTFHLMLIKA